MAALRRAAVAAAICLVLPVISSGTAFAARSLTVTPSTNLVDAQIVSVSGAGWSASVGVEFCQYFPARNQSERNCGGPIGDTTSSPSGEISFDYTVRQSMFVPEVNRTVNCAVEACYIAAAETSDITGTAHFAPITFVHPQPDGQIRRLSDSTIFGNDVYNSDGSHGQTVTHAIAPGADWSFAVQVQNDGQHTDDITVTAAPILSSPDITVRYFVGYFDVTSYVTGGGLTFANVPAGGIRKLPVQFRASSSAPVDARSHQLVTFTAGNAPITDAVRVGVGVIAP